MKSNGLLEAIQIEVTRYVIKNILDTSECEKYCLVPSNGVTKTKSVGCVLKTKKVNDQNHIFYKFEPLGKNTVILKEESDMESTFHYIHSVNVNDSRTGVMVTLNKTNTMNSVLKKCNEAQDQDICQDQAGNKISILCHGYSFDGNHIGDTRALLLCLVAQKVFSLNQRMPLFSVNVMCGKRCVTIPPNSSLCLLDLKSCEINATQHALSHIDVNSLQSCKYCVHRKDEKDDSKHIDIDLQKYVKQEKHFADNVLKDMNKIEVINIDGRTTEFVSDVEEMESSIPSSQLLLHILPSKSQYKIKSTALLFDIMYPYHFSAQVFSLYEENTVQLQQKNDDVDLNHWIQSRKAELFSSYRTRYGSEVEGQKWEGIIENLALSSITLDILSAALNHKVRVDTSIGGNFTSQKSMFMLYNFARLCKLEEHFQEKVKNGTYDVLTPLQDNDFSVLKEDQEWNLVLKYVLGYDALVQELSDHHFPDMNRVTIPAEKIYFFLSNLCRDLSKYYKQTKVLLDAQPHLFTLLYARVHLMMAVKNVMAACFDLLGIDPPSQM